MCSSPQEVDSCPQCTSAGLRGSGGAIGAVLQRHRQAMFRAQCDKRLRRDGVTGDEPRLPRLRKCCKHEHGLHPGEWLADAEAWPATEGEVRELGALVF